MLTNLKPAHIWQYFEEICKHPRPSKKEEKIIEYIFEFGKSLGLETKKDSVGNIVIRKEATPGFEKKETVVFQCHLDMVCEKNNDVEHNFETDAIQPYIDGDWVKAKGTTLGADNGIGMAMCLALLADKTISHGAIECLFTTDEETGLNGAKNLQEDFITGNTLINLDSEEDGEITIGCAGGIDTIGTLHYKTNDVPEKSTAFIIKVSGLKGGHSGEDINKELGNSNKILNRFLWKASESYKIKLSFFDGGNLRNAIAREAFAVFTVKEKKVNKLKKYFQTFVEELKNEYITQEPDLSFSLEETDLPKEVLAKKSQQKLLNLIYACPHGVLAMSKKVQGLTETSTNLASIKFTENHEIVITTSQRSSINSAKLNAAQMVESCLRLAKAKCDRSDGYPGRQPNPNSKILKIAINTYKNNFGKEPIVKAIHAGLECGLFLDTFPNLDMISIGPTVTGAHSPDEKIYIPSVETNWNWVLEILKSAPEK